MNVYTVSKERLILRMRQDDPTIKANNEQFTDNLSSELRIYVLLFLLYQYFLTLKNVIFVSQPPISMIIMRIVKFQKKNCKSLAKFVRQILLFKNLKGAESMGPF
ncbi:21889_t:CDS:2 [Rhizophagus irregularis]|nr:21889_t:CDS:2 [Rhizophagus irregularis]